MSAHCSECGCDIVYPPGTWPLGECPRCVPVAALRMCAAELAQVRFPQIATSEADVDDVVAEFLGKACGSAPENT